MSDIIGHNEPLVKIACNTCKHFNRGSLTLSCAAFDRIPDSILMGEDNHTEVLPGQENSIVYEKEDTDV